MVVDYSDIGSFPDAWTLTRVGDFASVKGGKRLPAGTALIPTRTSHPYLRIVDFKDGGIDKARLMFVPNDVFPQIARYVISARDIYISIVGTIGLVGVVGEGLDGASLTENAAKICSIADHADRDYVAAFLGSGWGQHQIGALTVGSTQPKLALFRIADIRVPLPPLAEQKAIAAVLGALDDKIELNRRMNATLEAMARALFQSWFVDFDPVRRNMDAESLTRRRGGRGEEKKGLPESNSPLRASAPPRDPSDALFPAHLEDSPLGHIPNGWKAGTVSDAFNFTMGQSPPGDTYNEEGNGLPFYQGRTDFGFRFPARRVFCTAPTRYAKAGDTLVSVRAPVGDINMANEECCIGRGVAAVRHKTGATSFTYHAMANLEPDFAKFEAEGTVFGSINKQNFENLRFVIPPPEIVAAYERQAAPLDEQIYNLEHQSRTLATLRDTLLPKLLSGEIEAQPNLSICQEQ